VEGWGNTSVGRPEGALCPYHNIESGLLGKGAVEYGKTEQYVIYYMRRESK